MKYSLNYVRSSTGSISMSFSKKRRFSNKFQKSLSNFNHFFKSFVSGKLHSKSGGKSGSWSASGSRSKND